MNLRILYGEGIKKQIFCLSFWGGSGSVKLVFMGNNDINGELKQISKSGVAFAISMMRGI